MLKSCRVRLGAIMVFAIVVTGCSTGSNVQTPTPPATPAPSVSQSVETQETETIVIRNQGGRMEGHTPRGFQGMGTGLFVGDNLNPRFPNGDGVQVFLTFDLGRVANHDVVSALLRPTNVQARGTPFQDLGSLMAEEVRYQQFSPALWNLAPMADGGSCAFSDVPNRTLQCDVTEAVRNSLDDDYGLAQFRLRLEKAGDGDGSPDLVMFFITDSNTNEPGIFELEVTINKS